MSQEHQEPNSCVCIPGTHTSGGKDLLHEHYPSTWQEQFILSRLVAPYKVILNILTGSAQGYAPNFHWVSL